MQIYISNEVMHVLITVSGGFLTGRSEGGRVFNTNVS